MTTLREKFEIPKRYTAYALGLMALGIISIIILFLTHGTSSNQETAARFWASLLQNSVYFLLVCNASLFFICATTLAWGGWQMSFRRVAEAISTCVPVMGVITIVILMVLIFGGNHVLYHWAAPGATEHDEILKHKAGFLNRCFFTTITIVAVAGWSLVGAKLRSLSRSIDNKPLSIEEGKKYMWNNTVWAAIYAVVFALTALSSIPWLWFMSLTAHWYSTMYAWYTFGSSWVAGIALITLFTVFLKNNGYLELTNREHIHDLGKFMFAFSIFWTYLWFSQYMLIWYSNQPEETNYFIARIGNREHSSPYKGMFFLNLILNFIIPLLLLMKRDSKRNYGTVTMMAVVILFGHWIDFYQMVMPAASPKEMPLILVDFGIALGFIGLIMFVTSRSLAKWPLIAKNHPFLKESIIHHT